MLGCPDGNPTYAATQLDSAHPWRNYEVDDVGSVCIPTRERGNEKILCPTYRIPVGRA
jgi:hypothetical protein